MGSLRFRPAEGRRSVTDPIPFPREPVSRIGRWEPKPYLSGRQVHEAERALERAQRRLDNLRAALGPDSFDDEEGPKAA